MDTRHKKIVISSSTNDADGLVSSRFARCEFYTLYDHNTLSFSYVENHAKDEMSGAGAKAAKQIAAMEATVVLVPEIGPKAYDALAAFDIEVFRYTKSCSVRDVIYDYYEQKLTKLTTSSTKGKHA